MCFCMYVFCLKPGGCGETPRIRCSTDLNTARLSVGRYQLGSGCHEPRGLRGTSMIRGRSQDRLTDAMNHRGFLRLGRVGVAGSVLATILPGATYLGGAGGAEAATTSVALGHLRQASRGTFTRRTDFSEMVGQEQAIIHRFQDWVMGFDFAYMVAAVSHGGLPRGDAAGELGLSAGGNLPAGVGTLHPVRKGILARLYPRRTT